MLSRLLALAASLAALALATDGSARLFQPPAVQGDIEAVVKLLEQKKVDRAAIAKNVAAIQKKHTLDDLMKKVYKPTKSGGIGWNPANKGPGDSIEKRINDLATKKELTPAQLAKEKNLILRAAAYNRAMHEITKAFAPAKIVAGKGQKQWKQHNDEMNAGTKELIDAVKANDPKALKKAMGRVAAGCNGCHTDFR